MKKLCVETITNNGTNIILTVSNSTNIESLECLCFGVPCNKSINDIVTGEPLPVLININGTDVALLNKYSQPVLSNKVPRRAKGYYVAEGTATPYAILGTTPCTKCS